MAKREPLSPDDLDCAVEAQRLVYALVGHHSPEGIPSPDGVALAGDPALARRFEYGLKLLRERGDEIAAALAERDVAA